MSSVAERIAQLPLRAGPAPRSTVHPPQQQLEQIPDLKTHQAFWDRVESWPDVDKAPSMRAPDGTLGLFLRPADARGPAEAFMLDTEFAHLHPLPDGSLHMVLPPSVRAQAIKKGWAIPHPLAGLPTVSPLIVLVYAPRDAAEQDVVVSLISAAEAFARGHLLD